MKLSCLESLVGEKHQSLQDDVTVEHIALIFHPVLSQGCERYERDGETRRKSCFSQNTEIRASIKMINFMAKIARMDYFIFFILRT